MPNLRRPITWLILLEVVVVGALAATAAEVVAAHAPRLRQATPAGVLGALPVVAGLVDATPSPVVLAPTPHPLGPTPGLALSSSFLARELATINHDDAAWERSQWTIIEAGLAFARAYVEGVVLPGLRSATAPPT